MRQTTASALARECLRERLTTNTFACMGDGLASFLETRVVEAPGTRCFELKTFGRVEDTTLIDGASA